MNLIIHHFKILKNQKESNLKPNKMGLVIVFKVKEIITIKNQHNIEKIFKQVRKNKILIKIIYKLLFKIKIL